MKLAVAITIVVALCGQALAHENKLPLGDQKLSSQPKVGHVFACQRAFPGGGGATRTGPWISNGYWDPSAKPHVEGNVRWPNARISIAVEGSERVVRANNLPLHATGEFPVKQGTTAYSFDRNPNSIGEQDILLRMPVKPALAGKPACVPMGMIGFATSGVAIFNAFDLQGRDAPAYEIQDRCNGHPERTSQYHYHDWSPCLKGADADTPVGWMLDGFPILGLVDAKGRAFTNADLDACHGRSGLVKIDGKMVNMYHYRFTREFPYTIGCFRGAPIRKSDGAPPPFVPFP